MDRDLIEFLYEHIESCPLLNTSLLTVNSYVLRSDGDNCSPNNERKDLFTFLQTINIWRLHPFYKNMENLQGKRDINGNVILFVGSWRNQHYLRIRDYVKGMGFT